MKKVGKRTPSNMGSARIAGLAIGLCAVVSACSSAGRQGAPLSAPSEPPVRTQQSPSTDGLSVFETSRTERVRRPAQETGSVETARVSEGCSRSGPWRIMPLGDSLTGGNSDLGYADSYRKHLWDSLRAGGRTDIDFVGTRKLDDGTFDGENSGWGGFRAGPDNDVPDADGLPGSLYPYIEKFIAQPYTLNEESKKDWVTFADPDIVLLNIGTNDGEANQAAIEARLAGLVAIIQIKAPTARVVLSSIPPQGGNVLITPLVGKAARKLALASGGRVMYADIRGRMTVGDATKGALPFSPDDWKGDGDTVHMKPSGGKKFAAAWLPTVEAALKAPRCA